MLTVDEIHEILTTRPTGLHRGRLMALREHRTDPKRVSAPGQRQLLDYLIAAEPATDTPPRHPADDVRPELPTGAVGDDTTRDPTKPRQLTDSDRAWLARIPDDPAQVSYQDAVGLATIARAIAPRGGDSRFVNRSDARLVESIWAPVRARFDRAVARHDLTEARRPLPRIPAGYVDTALAEAVAATTTELDADEIRHRGARLAREIHAAREQNRETAISKALKAQAALEQADRDRALTA